MVMPKTLLDAIKYFSNPANCLSYMVSVRWPNGVTCPVCGADKPYFDKGRNGFECRTRHPKRKFSLKMGTVFEDSPIGLDKWLPCVWMVVNMKNGVSSHEVARSLGVTQKTAWFMLHRIRLAMQDHETGGKLNGEVEADETFIGGKARNMHASRRAEAMQNTKGRTHYGKTAVMGLLERHDEGHSYVRLKVVPNVRRHNTYGFVREHVAQGSHVMTDRLPSYDRLTLDHYVHDVVDHAETYVLGTVHTNGLENFWSLLKRGLHGTYVSVEPFHLFRYLDEQAFRFNHRKGADDSERFQIALSGITGRRLTYKELIGDGKPTKN